MTDRSTVLRARAHLPDWVADARLQAYADLFEGADAVLTPAEVQRLDALDSEMERRGGDGVWGTDRYGIHTAGPADGEDALGVVCTYHPQVGHDSVLRGDDGLDDETEARLDDALWRYAERVATLAEADLEAFLDGARP